MLGFLKVFAHRLGSALHMEFFIDVAQVGAHRFRTDAQAAGDFLVGDALGQQRVNFLFPRVVSALCRQRWALPRCPNPRAGRRDLQPPMSVQLGPVAAASRWGERPLELLGSVGKLGRRCCAAGYCRKIFPFVSFFRG